MITANEKGVLLNGKPIILLSSLQSSDPALASQFYYLGMAHAVGLMIAEFETLVTDLLLNYQP